MRYAYIIFTYVAFYLMFTTSALSVSTNKLSSDISESKSSVLEKPTKNKGYLEGFEDPVPEEMPSMESVGIKMLISLTVVLGILFAVLFVMKRYFPGAISSSDANLKLVKVIEKIPVAPRQYIYLVWAVDRMLVLGMAPGGLNLLTEIKDQTTLEEKLPNEFSDTLTRANLNFSQIYNG